MVGALRYPVGDLDAVPVVIAVDRAGVAPWPGRDAVTGQRGEVAAALQPGSEIGGQPGLEEVGEPRLRRKIGLEQRHAGVGAVGLLHQLSQLPVHGVGAVTDECGQVRSDGAHRAVGDVVIRPVALVGDVGHVPPPPSVPAYLGTAVVHREHPMTIAEAVAAVLEATDWSAVVAALDSLPAGDVQAVAAGLWDRAWHLLGEGEAAAARQVGLLGELVERVGLVGQEATVEAFLDLGAIDVGLDEVARLAAGGGPGWFAARYDTGVLHAHRYSLTGEVADLDPAVEALADATGTSDATDRADAVEALASVLWQRFTATTRSADLERGLAAVAAVDSALGHNVRGNLLKERYDWFGDGADLDAAIAAYERAVALSEPGGDDDLGFRGNLAMAHADRYLRTGADVDLVAAEPDVDALVGPRLALRAEELNRPEDTAAVQTRIEILTRAVVDQHPYAPERFVDLGQLGSALHARWRSTGDPTDLERARRCGQRALMATPRASVAFPVRAYAVADTALSAGSGEEAIRWATVALDVIPEHGPLRPAAASLLGAAYNDRYDRTGDVDDLTTPVRSKKRRSSPATGKSWR